jgi:ribosome-binding factor A
MIPDRSTSLAASKRRSGRAGLSLCVAFHRMIRVCIVLFAAWLASTAVVAFPHSLVTPATQHYNGLPSRTTTLRATRRTHNSNPPDTRTRAVDSRHSQILKQKVCRVLRDELTDIICSCEIKAAVYPEDRLLRAVTITDVDITSDLSAAKIYISVMGSAVEKRQVYIWLSNNVGQVRYSLAQRLRDLRRLPEITFALADTQSSQYLNKVLDEISSTGTNAREEEEGVDFEEVDE